MYITGADIKEALFNELERLPTEEEMTAFKEYLGLDVGEWLKENARSFIRDRIGAP